MEVLRTLFGKTVVEHVGFYGITTDKIEIELEIIVESIRRDGRLLHWPYFLIHFECCGKVLSLAYLDDRNIAHEHYALELGLLPCKCENLCLDFIRAVPVGADYVCAKSFFFQNLLIRIELFVTSGEGLVIGYDGKCRRGLDAALLGSDTASQVVMEAIASLYEFIFQRAWHLFAGSQVCVDFVYDMLSVPSPDEPSENFCALDARRFRLVRVAHDR